MSQLRSLTVLLLFVAASCSGPEDDEPVGCAVAQRDTAYDPRIDPAEFSAVIDNKYLPLVPGTVYRHRNGRENVEVAVTSDTKVIMGVTSVVVRDTVTLAATGEVLEDTFDWYAQDKAGNVWYMGEATKEFP